MSCKILVVSSLDQRVIGGLAKRLQAKEISATLCDDECLLNEMRAARERKHLAALDVTPTGANSSGRAGLGD
jgi:hypothetical protein